MPLQSRSCRRGSSLSQGEFRRSDVTATLAVYLGATTDGRKHIHYSIKKGAHFATEVKQLETDLTADMIAS